MNATAPQFTTFNAKEMAARSVAARRARKAAEQDRLLNATALAQALAERVKDRPLDAKVLRVENQLAKLDDLLDESDDYKELNALTQAKERLMSVWCRLTGLPREGVRKTSKGRPTLPDLQPVVSPVAPEQSPVVNRPDEPNG